MNHSPLIFQEAHPTRTEICAEAWLYRGIRFDMKRPKIVWDGDKPNIQKSRAECVFLLFCILQRKGYIPADFDYRAWCRVAGKFSQDLDCSPGSLDAALRAVLEANCTRVEIAERRPADIILSQMDRVNAKGAHHVSLMMPKNQILHAIDNDDINASCVMVQDWCAIERNVVEIWQLPGLRDGE